MTITRLTETMTLNDNDDEVIAVMKKTGAWHQMKSYKMGTDKFIPFGNYLFCWWGSEQDSGFTMFQSTDSSEILTVFNEITNQNTKIKIMDEQQFFNIPPANWSKH
jgi:hypothetical protein